MTYQETRQPASQLQASQFHIRYQSLFKEGRALAFPCNEQGHVDMDALTERSRRNYLFARAMVGREYARPSVRLS